MSNGSCGHHSGRQSSCESGYSYRGACVAGGDHHEAERLEEAYLNTLQLALANGYQSIAFPAISTGVYGYPRAAAAEIAVNTVLRFTTRRALPEQIYFVCFDDETAQLYNRLLTQQGDDNPA